MVEQHTIVISMIRVPGLTGQKPYLNTNSKTSEKYVSKLNKTISNNKVDNSWGMSDFWLPQMCVYVDVYQPEYRVLTWMNPQIHAQI